MKLFYHSCIIILLLTCFSCGVKRYLPNGSKLYNGASVTVVIADSIKDVKSSLRKKLTSITSPKKNKTFLGRYNKVWWWYFIGESKKEKGFKNWLRGKLGDPPVLSSHLDLALNVSNMQGYLESHGHFENTVTADTVSKGFKIKAVYTVRAGHPYTIGGVTWRLDSSEFSKEILRLKGDPALKTGEQYDADKVKVETERVNGLLKEKGYYYFKPENILTYIDTNHSNYTASVYLALQPETPSRNKQPFRINRIMAVVQDASRQSLPDTTLHPSTALDNIYIVDTAQRLKPPIWPRAITYRPGQLYSLPEQNRSLTRLNSYGIFKFIRTEFKPSPGKEQNDLLDAYYYTNISQKKKVQVELGGFFRSNNYSGGQLGLSWGNKNIFRGAETFTIKTTGSFEIAVNDSLEQNNNFRIGAEASLLVPKFMAPVITGRRFAFIPKTRFVFSYDWVRRQNLYSEYYAHFRYELNWSDTVTKEQRFTPFSVTAYNTADLDNDFQGRMTVEEKLQYPIPSVINFSTSYHYLVTNISADKRNIFNLHTSLEMSGTVLGLIKGTNGYYSTKIGNAYFTQYIRSDLDMRYVRKLGKDLFWANRFIIGVSYPYGNSPFLPYTRQFIIGGANSLRGFLPRQLGPGSTQATTSQQSTYPQIGGDYKLELNMELRFPLVGRIKGAVFADAGNIWMKDTLLYTPKGKLTKDFYKEIAIDAGAGLRLDITFLVIRLDLGVPFYKPFLPEGQRWVFNDIQPLSEEWRKENLVFNLAIGYPF